MAILRRLYLAAIRPFVRSYCYIWLYGYLCRIIVHSAVLRVSLLSFVAV